MSNNILLKRGTSSNFDSVNLKAGEPAFVTDTKKLYIGDGLSNVLINPISKPLWLDTTNFFTKVKVNDYGQVIAQDSLSSNDIPSIPFSKVTGLGTAATLNTGTSSGNIPTLDNSGRLLESMMPKSIIAGYAYLTYISSDGLNVPAGQYVPLDVFSSSSSSDFSMDTPGIITVKSAGIYIISYNLTSATLSMSTALGAGAANLWTGTMAKSSTTSVTPFVNTSAILVKSITSPPEKFGIKNTGSTNLVLLSGHGSINICKIV